MSLFRLLPLCLVLLVAVTGCDPVAENRLYREGIGTELSRAGLADVTRLQNEYIGHLCQQAIGTITTVGETQCSRVEIGAADWPIIVQAGMNDIDLRCDAYLAWLDDKRRSHAPILAQLNTMHAAAEGIMRIAGSSANPIAIVGLAFGLASDTFTNVRSRLILEVNHSTVQTIVLRRQNTYREGVKGQPINNRAAAMYALRSYLRLCMPFTIEMEINTTVVLFEKSGTRAVDAAMVSPLISPDTVRTAAVVPRDVVARPVRPPSTVTFPDFFESAAESQNTSSRLKSIQRSLCVPATEIGQVGPLTRAHIRIFESSYRPPKGTPPRRNGLLDESEITEIQGNRWDCSSEAGLNYYERRTFLVPNALMELVTNLRKFATDGSLQTSPKMSDIRAAIRAVRTNSLIRPKLTIQLPENMKDQLTPDLDLALSQTP